MVGVAKEMERRGLELPLLIGGATTSKQHTAVRIAPEYGQPTLHVLDASRVVGVVGDLLDGDRRARLDAENRADQERLRALHAEKGRKPLLSLARGSQASGRRSTGTRRTSPSRRSSARGSSRRRSRCSRGYIDWTFFFHAWELKGRYPGDPRRPREGGGRARPLRRSERAARRDRRRGLAAGPRRVRVLAGERRGRRRRARRRRPLPDAPTAEPTTPTRARTARSPTSSLPRRRAFPITSAPSPSRSTGPSELAERFAAENDDYRAIMVRALADRLAEAFAE